MGGAWRLSNRKRGIVKELSQMAESDRDRFVIGRFVNYYSRIGYVWQVIVKTPADHTIAEMIVEQGEQAGFLQMIGGFSMWNDFHDLDYRLDMSRPVDREIGKKLWELDLPLVLPCKGPRRGETMALTVCGEVVQV